MRQENAPRRSLRRPLLGLLTLSLLAAPALAQATDPSAPAAPNLGLPSTTTPGAPLPGTAAPDTAPSETTPAEAAPSESAPSDSAPAEDAPTVETTGPAVEPPGAGAPGENSRVTVPKLDGEEVLKTVPTVLGEALIYRGDAEDALTRTAQALTAEGYEAADTPPTADAAGVTTLTLTKDDQTFELTERSTMGLTVVALARVPGRTAAEAPSTQTPPAPTDAAPAEASPAEANPAATDPVDAAPAPAEPAPGGTSPADPTPVDPPTDPVPVDPATTPVTPPSQP